MSARQCCLALVLLCVNGLTSAHQQSQSFLRLAEPDGATAAASLQIDLALVDLEHAVGLDDDADARIRWSELRAHEAEIRRYVESRVSLYAGVAEDRRACALRFDRLRFNTHADGGYAVLDYNVTCPALWEGVELHYALLFDLDAAHRSLVSLTRADGTQESSVVSAAFRTLAVGARGDIAGSWDGALPWITQGLHHIWTGLDHLLFLMTLLLPAVVRREPGLGWVSQASLGTALRDVARVVTAFTIAHSLTLGLAAKGLVEFDTRWVESLIALTVLLGALNILFPVVRERRWLLALVFGLVHGLGFAAALGDLGLAGPHVIRNLLLFNVGVELGQLAIVAVFVPAAFLLRNQVLYRNVATPAAAAGVGVLALWWLTERLAG